MSTSFANPFRPGAGHMPPYLAGREDEKEQLKKILHQDVILENMVLTGLRGVGKTVLLETFKPIAVDLKWRWVGADLSESTCVSEETTAKRIITDISMITAGFSYTVERQQLGFGTTQKKEEIALSYSYWLGVFNNTPGLVADKIKAVIENAWEVIKSTGSKGVVFAYDEAQNMSDKPKKDEYPLAMLLDIFQSVQRKGIRFLLVLTGLPTLFPKLVEARTFAERMFRIVTLTRLNKEASREAILEPIKKAEVKLNDESVDLIISSSDGYPYFIQFICREVYDVFQQKLSTGKQPSVPLQEIESKLDVDFFAGRWAKATDRQRDLLVAIAALENCDQEFTVQELFEKSRAILEKPFSSSHINQMLSALTNSGLVYKNRHGKYSFAVPLFGRFIRRQQESEQAKQHSFAF